MPTQSKLDTTVFAIDMPEKTGLQNNTELVITARSLLRLVLGYTTMDNLVKPRTIQANMDIAKRPSPATMAKTSQFHFALTILAVTDLISDIDMSHFSLKKPHQLWQRGGIILLGSLISFCACADQRQLTTLALQNQLPAQVLPVIRPLLSSGSTATEFNNQLILNVTDTELAKIKQLLGAIDQRPRQLMISVKTPGSSSASNRSVDVDGSININNGGNDDISIGTGRPLRGDNDHLRVRVDDSSSRATSNGQQQVRAVEGMPAQISIGVTTPITNSYTTMDGRRVINRDYYPVNQSVSVIARVIDNRVIVDIDQQNNQLDSNQNLSEQNRSGQIVQRRSVPINGGRHSDRNRHSRDINNAPTIQTQSISTQVSGKIGEWIALGGIDQSSGGSNSGFSGASSRSRSASTSVFIKVDILDE